MNLGALATAVGQRLGVDTSQASTRDGAAVRSSLTLRHDQLYRAFLWKDAIIEWVLPVSNAYAPTSNYMPTKGRVICPSIFQLVLGVRFGHHSLDVQRPMFYYRADYARFMDERYTREFMLLSAAVWEFDTPQNISVLANDPADVNTNVTLDELQSDEVSVVRSQVPLGANIGSAAGTTDRIDNFLKPATTGSVVLGIQYFGGAEPYLTHPSERIGAPMTFYYGGVQDLNIKVGSTVRVSGGGNQVTLLVTALAYIALFGYGFTGTPLFLSGDSANETIIPDQSSIQISNIPSNCTLQANDVSAQLCQRIQLVGKPCNTAQYSEHLHILGKRISPPFSAETDIPGINGLDGILAALAYYDFKQRDEQGGSPDAIAALNEAVGPNFLVGGKPGGWLGKLIESEVIQAAYNCRIIPSQGFGRGGFDEPQGSKCDPYGGYY